MADSPSRRRGRVLAQAAMCCKQARHTAEGSWPVCAPIGLSAFCLGLFIFRFKAHPSPPMLAFGCNCGNLYVSIILRILHSCPPFRSRSSCVGCCAPLCLGVI